MKRTFPLFGGCLVLTLNPGTLATLRLTLYTINRSAEASDYLKEWQHMGLGGGFYVYHIVVPSGDAIATIRALRTWHDGQRLSSYMKDEDREIELGIAGLMFVARAFEVER